MLSIVFFFYRDFLFADGSEIVQGGVGRRQDCVQTSGHPVQQHVGTESLQVLTSLFKSVKK